MKIKDVFLSVKNKTAKTVVVVSTALVTSPTFALDGANTTTDAINAAVDAGMASVQLTVAGVIGLAALGFGVGMIISYLRR